MAQTPIAWYDPPTNTKDRKVLVSEQMQIPALRMFGYHTTTHAIPALQLHYHKDSFEFTYLVRGNTVFTSEGKTYPITGGDVFMVYPNEVHDSGSMPMGLHQMYWFQLEINDPEHFLFLPPQQARELIQMLRSIPHHVIKADPHESNNLLSAIFRDLWDGTLLRRMEAAHLLTFFLYRMVEFGGKTQFTLTPDIGRVTEYILEHIGEELPMADLARIALLSESRFKEKFKRQMGTSPRDFVNYHKVAAAKILLLEGRSVTDVAMDLGFSSSNYFSSVFRRYTACAPSEYPARHAARAKKES